MDREKLEKRLFGIIIYSWLIFLFGSFIYVADRYPDALRGNSDGPLSYFLIVWMIVLSVSILFGAYWVTFLVKVILGERHPILAVKEDIRVQEERMERENFELLD